jgi:hypothetical protein
MDTLRHIYSSTVRLPAARVIALILIIVVPGGLVLPICYGLYGAIRHSLSTKVPNRGAAEEATGDFADRAAP